MGDAIVYMAFKTFSSCKIYNFVSEIYYSNKQMFVEKEI